MIYSGGGIQISINIVALLAETKVCTVFLVASQADPEEEKLGDVEATQRLSKLAYSYDMISDGMI